MVPFSLVEEPTCVLQGPRMLLTRHASSGNGSSKRGGMELSTWPDVVDLRSQSAPELRTALTKAGRHTLIGNDNCANKVRWQTMFRHVCSLSTSFQSHLSIVIVFARTVVSHPRRRINRSRFFAPSSLSLLQNLSPKTWIQPWNPTIICLPTCASSSSGTVGFQLTPQWIMSLA